MRTVLFFSLFLFLSLSALAEFKVDKNGKIGFDRHEWRQLTQAEELALDNPGMEIPVDIKSISERVDFFHYVEVEKYSEVVVFNDSQFKTIQKDGKKYGKPNLAIYYIIINSYNMYGCI